MRPCLSRLIAAGVVLLAGCQTPTTYSKNVDATTLIGGKAQILPATGNATKPTQTAGLQTSTSTSSGALIHGTVSIDANYAVTVGAGTVINAGGANVINAGGANVINAGGANVINAGGANVINAGGANYRIASDTAPQVGTLMPVMGMKMQAYSLLTGKAIGNATTTDKTGSYSLSLPSSVKEANVLVKAVIPSMASDPRLNYAILAPSTGGEVDLDEDSALATTYLQQIFAAKLALAMAPQPANPDPNAPGSSPVIVSLHSALPADLLQLASAKPQLVQGLSVTIADVLISELPLSTLTFSDKSSMMTYVTGMIRALDQATAAKMQTDGTNFFKNYFIANGQPNVDIKRPSDLAGMLVSNYLSKDLTAFMQMGQVINGLGLTFTITADDLQKMESAGLVLSTAMGTEMNPQGATPAQTTVQQTIQGAISALIAND